MNALREAGCEVLGAVSIFTYELEKGRKMLAEADVVAYSLTDFTTLISVAESKGYIREEDMAVLEEWKMDPEQWDKRHR